VGAAFFVSGGAFITGTDTGVGKTLATASLISVLQLSGLRVVGMKPVASGSSRTHDGWHNADAAIIAQYSSGTPAYSLVNPFAFEPPIAPHIAARDAGVDITLDPIIAAFSTLSQKAECVVVEGVGGWCAPLSATLMQADIARELKLPVILVVGLRLGCLNHTLLSARAIEADGCTFLGWIGSQIDPDMARVDDNLATLRERLPAPCLGVFPFTDSPDPRVMQMFLRGSVPVISAACRREP
jgi:dethiobiotin synthetase